MIQSANRDAVLIVISEEQPRKLLERVLVSAGFPVLQCSDRRSAEQLLTQRLPGLIIANETLIDSDGVNFAAAVTRDYPAVPIMLLVQKDTPELLKKAMRAGVSDYMVLPLRVEEAQKAVSESIERARRRETWVLEEARRASSSLQEKLDEMETLAGLGRTITGTLDLDTILASVVEAAVGLTGAEEGSLLMLDAASGELYMRAARNFQDDFVRTFRMPVQDSLVSSVLQSGSPVLINEQTPQKIKTSYLVHSLIYVPLKVKNQIIGVLGVDNRLQRQSFQEHDVKILSAVAEYAVIAIENAHLYEATNIERRKLETILGSIEDGVIVLDQDQRLLMANGQVQNSFTLQDQSWQGHRYEEFFVQEDMQALIENDLGTRAEVSLADGRIFDGLAVSIPEVGTVVTLHDITYLKKLDRIKSEFVNTVSHDLRSPLTAIMGYVELIERAGPVNELQKEFVRRVMGSVVNITRLVDDLLNLGRIEAGFDVRKDNIQMETLINLSIDALRKRIREKELEVAITAAPNLPALVGNPPQIRQMVDHLLENAVKYTSPGGTITIKLDSAQSQMLVRITDNGIGIPTQELGYVYDKFYRASNIHPDSQGSGLGLAIVKSIVENHHGRIWIDSTIDRGTEVSVVLPLAGG